MGALTPAGMSLDLGLQLRPLHSPRWHMPTHAHAGHMGHLLLHRAMSGELRVPLRGCLIPGSVVSSSLLPPVSLSLSSAPSALSPLLGLLSSLSLHSLPLPLIPVPLRDPEGLASLPALICKGNQGPTPGGF